MIVHASEWIPYYYGCFHPHCSGRLALTADLDTHDDTIWVLAICPMSLHLEFSSFMSQWIFFLPKLLWAGFLSLADRCYYFIVSMLSLVWLFVAPWIVARQAPLSMGFSRLEYWRWLPFPSPGDLPNPGIEPMSPSLEGEFFTTEPPD